MVKRGTVYESRDSLIRQMCSDGKSLSEMSRILGGHKEDLKYYIETNQIPHPPFEMARRLEKNYFWRGGRIVDDGKYILIKVNDHPYADRHGYVREHRLVMERKLGRYLLPTEVVHHIDGNPMNNDPDNLQLFARNGEHLAQELPGKPHKMSDEGRKRLSEAMRRRWSRK